MSQRMSQRRTSAAATPIDAPPASSAPAKPSVGSIAIVEAWGDQLDARGWPDSCAISGDDWPRVRDIVAKLLDIHKHSVLDAAALLAQASGGSPSCVRYALDVLRDLRT